MHHIRDKDLPSYLRNPDIRHGINISWTPGPSPKNKSRGRIYFNNHARAKSVRNAFLLMDMLLIEHNGRGFNDWSSSLQGVLI
jgi:hypothetical protein